MHRIYTLLNVNLIHTFSNRKQISQRKSLNLKFNCNFTGYTKCNVNFQLQISIKFTEHIKAQFKLLQFTGHLQDSLQYRFEYSLQNSLQYSFVGGASVTN